MSWQTFAMIYLGIGVVCAITGTSEEAMDFYDAHPDNPFGGVEGAIALLIAAFILTLIWPIAIVWDPED